MADDHGVSGQLVGHLFMGMFQVANNKSIIRLNNERFNKKREFVEQRYDHQNSLLSKQDELKQAQEELTVKTSTIKQEEEKMSTFRNVNNDANTKFMVGLGMTGDGKSTSLNRLYGDESEDGNKGPFEANDGDESVTQEPEHKEVVINNVQSVIVDTPGYKDSGNRDDLHFNNLEQYLYGCGGVDAFLLVMNGAKNRFDANIQEMLKEYGKYFGLNFWKHLIIIVTRIEGREKKKFIEKEKEKKLRKNMRDKMEGIDEKCELPVITIGFGEDLAAFRGDVTDEVVRISNNYSKLVCKHIQSPIKRLRAEKQELKQRIQNLKDEIAPIQQKISEIDGRIAELDDKINDPEAFPLITKVAPKVISKVASAAISKIIAGSSNELHNVKLRQVLQKIKELTAKTNAINKEEKKMSTFENINNDANTKFIIGLGMTGVGKSTVLNRLSGDESKYGNKGPFETDNSDYPVTQMPELKEVEINNIQSVIVDTPGYRDSANRDHLHFYNLEQYLYGCGGVDAFLLVMNGAKNTFDVNIQIMFKEYGNYFGSNFWNHLIIIITRIEGFEKERYNDEERAKKLRENITKIFIDDADEKCALPVITIGFGEDSAAFREDVMNEVVEISNKKCKLIWTDIQSPIERLKAEREELKKKIKNEITQIQQEMKGIDGIAELDDMLILQDFH